MAMRRKKPAEFFWARVRKESECWIWTGRRDPFGYGVVQLGKNLPRTGAHRLSWEIHVGPLPKDADNKRGTCVLHKCDNPQCVNPGHLFLGDRRLNSHDAQKKGRLSVPSKGWCRNKTHCKRGHPFDEENTYRFGTTRKCRRCHADDEAARRTSIRNETLNLR